jgi:hypothetical protein
MPILNNQDTNDNRRKRDDLNNNPISNISSVNQTVEVQPNTNRQLNTTENVQEVFKHNHFDVI